MIVWLLWGSSGMDSVSYLARLTTRTEVAGRGKDRHGEWKCHVTQHHRDRSDGMQNHIEVYLDTEDRITGALVLA